MKILLTGGGTGGHFYPLIAVAKSLKAHAAEQGKEVKLYFMAPDPFNAALLAENGIEYVPSTAGKIRHYFSLKNFSDIFKTLWGMAKAVWTLFWLYPDVVFGKGGYTSFPTLFAAWFLRIPIVIHESDSIPGRVNKIAGRWATRVAVSYPQAAEYFKKSKTAFTGNPIRPDIMNPTKEGSYEYFGFNEKIPTVLVLGGSLGATAINDTILDGLSQLVSSFQIIHQTGDKNFQAVKNASTFMLENSEFKDRYKPLASLDAQTLQKAVGISNIIISRAGSTIFEIAHWGTPAIIIPIPQDISHDQTSNAYSYARTGAAEVIEQSNLTTHILYSELVRITSSSDIQETMKKAAHAFSRTDAADVIATEIISIAASHY